MRFPYIFDQIYMWLQLISQTTWLKAIVHCNVAKLIREKAAPTSWWEKSLNKNNIYATGCKTSTHRNLYSSLLARQGLPKVPQ